MSAGVWRRAGRLAGKAVSCLGPAEMLAVGGLVTMLWGVGNLYAGTQRTDALLVTVTSAAAMWGVALCLLLTRELR